MRQLLLGNMNFHGTGATVASMGSTPALDSERGYLFDMSRVSALAMSGILKLARTSLATVGSGSRLFPDDVDAAIQNYVRWVKVVIGKDGQPGPDGAPINSHNEGKWDISQQAPVRSSCSLQTDGAAVRAQAILAMVNRSASLDQRKELWEVAKFDLDWLAQGANIQQGSCDIWEELGDGNMFWNRMAIRGALIMGYYVAQGMGDPWRTHKYFDALDRFIGNPVATHKVSRDDGLQYIGECAVDAPHNGDCVAKEKNLDAAVILALAHSGWTDFRQVHGASLAPASSPTAALVANTIRAHVDHWCDILPINRLDTNQNVPGVLLGRYPRDTYGTHNFGNAWLVTSAALASVLYQAAQHAAWEDALSPEVLAAWRRALTAHSFAGTPSDFIAAGDAVLMRLHTHISKDNFHFHIYEQIDRNNGEQYNAKDLTWSLTEVLSAVSERRLAMHYASGKQWWRRRRLRGEGETSEGGGAQSGLPLFE